MKVPVNATAPVTNAKPPAKSIFSSFGSLFGSTSTNATKTVVGGRRRKNTRKQSKKSRKTRSRRH